LHDESHAEISLLRYYLLIGEIARLLKSAFAVGGGEMPKNCWEVYNCGREPGGERAEEFGICRVTVSESFSGRNNGENAGRCCWQVAGTFSSNADCAQLANVEKCEDCGFLKRVRYEESGFFRL